MSSNPYFDLATAVAEYDDALRRLASAFPRNDPCRAAMMDLARLTGVALRALDRIHTPPESQR